MNCYFLHPYEASLLFPSFSFLLHVVVLWWSTSDSKSCQLSSSCRHFDRGENRTSRKPRQFDHSNQQMIDSTHHEHSPIHCLCPNSCCLFLCSCPRVRWHTPLIAIRFLQRPITQTREHRRSIRQDHLECYDNNDTT